MTRLLLVAAALVAVLAAAGLGAGAEWDVYPGAGTPIQDVIDGAGAGDTIYVHAGTYYENVDVWKRVTLIGDGADVVKVRAELKYGDAFHVTADWVNIRGFAVTGATKYNSGFYLNNADHCNISGNSASNDDGYGIYLKDSSNNTLMGNTFVNDGLLLEDSYHNNVENNTVNGKPLVYLEDAADYTITNAGQVILVNCKNITAEDLNLSNTTVGIELWGTDNSVITSNTASNNDRYGIYLKDSSNNTLMGNTANSNNDWYGIGIYIEGSSNNTLTSNTASNNDKYGIVLWSSNNNDLAGNIANSNSLCGIELQGSSNNTLTSNTASNNDDWGIQSFFSRDNILTGNVASDNWCGGILHVSSNANTLTNNIASDNWCGIYLGDSSNNTLYHNNLANNTWTNTFDGDGGTNAWDSGSEGNYYSDYDGIDDDSNGIGDTRHPIPGGENIDRFPLMQPWSERPLQKGDLNHDGNVTPADAAIALRLAAIGAHDPVADVNGDDRVTSLDALMILQAAAKRIEL